MVTQPGRTDLFKRAVLDFTNQRYSARKLTIVTKYPDYEMAEERRFVHELLPGVERNRINWQFVDHVGTPLVALRNIAMERSGPTDYFCVWDDDDRHHPERLAVQLQALQSQRAVGSYLATQLYHFTTLDKLFVVHWGSKPCPGTLLYRALGVHYEPLRRQEGPGFVKLLQQEGQLVGVHDRAELYLKTIHAATTMPVGHHRQFAAAHAWPQPQVLARRKWLEQLVAYYRLAGPLLVCGMRGEAFTIG
jgi:hypothetical protein